MQDTVKKRLLVLTTSLLLFFGALVVGFNISFFFSNIHTRQAMMETKVSYIAEKIGNNYDAHHKIVKELSMIASTFYKTKNQDKNILVSTIKNHYKDNLPENGVGIWYNAYAIHPSKKWFCIFAYRKNGEIVFNNSLENDEYNYIAKKWFTYIQEQAQKGVKNIYMPTTCGATGSVDYVLTIGSGIYANNKLIGVITGDWKLEALKDELAQYKPTKHSYILFADKESDFIISLTNSDNSLIGSSLKRLKWYKNDLKSGEIVKDGKKLYVTFPKILDNGLLMVVNIPFNEMYGVIYARLFTMIFLMILSVIFIALITQRVITKNVNEPVEYLVEVAKKIGSGDLDTKMEIAEPAEFVQLADAFNRMTTDIKDYITNLNRVTTEKKKMEEELSIAHSIQASSLPSVFPPYPERKEFDIFADMIPAKEVGGDFYDFFFVDKNKFVFLIADVSGKGVPAALFMMETKTLLRNVIKTGIPLDEAVSKVNHKICKKNKHGFFVTAFISKIDLSNGKIEFVNAGHNPPLIKRNNGEYCYLETNHNLVLGAKDGFAYQKTENEFTVDDKIFLYTDGVTEATNKDLELYGEKRLSEILNNNGEYEPQDVIPVIKKDVYDYLGEENQTDDITVLIFRYNGNNQELMNEEYSKQSLSMILPAKVESFSSLLGWIEDICNNLKIKTPYRYKLNIAVEEIFVNIASYAYPSKEGDVKVIFNSIGINEIEIQFIDSGIQYNPLKKPDPDINQSIEERQVGGLGIFMTKNSMDYMDYKFVDNQNILTMRLKYETEED